jgi:hypothetical protein
MKTRTVVVAMKMTMTMKSIRIRTLMHSAAAVVVASCLAACEGLSVSLSSDGKFVVSGTIPPPKGKVVEVEEKGK